MNSGLSGINFINTHFKYLNVDNLLHSLLSLLTNIL